MILEKKRPPTDDFGRVLVRGSGNHDGLVQVQEMKVIWIHTDRNCLSFTRCQGEGPDPVEHCFGCNQKDWIRAQVVLVS